MTASDSDRELVTEALANAEALTAYHFTLDLKETEFITVPAKLRNYAAIEKEVVIIGDTYDEAAASMDSSSPNADTW